MPKRNNQQLTEDYLRWLEPQLQDGYSDLDKRYWDLLCLMFETEFIPILDRDKNRVADGHDIRVEFARKERLQPNRLDHIGPISFLEVLIALSRRMAFNGGGNAPGWAWHFLNNLELHRMSDPLTPAKRRRAMEIMDTVIGRTYFPDGRGGFFPLLQPDDDQTRVELWYQMNFYIEELHPER